MQVVNFYGGAVKNAVLAVFLRRYAAAAAQNVGQRQLVIGQHQLNGAHAVAQHIVQLGQKLRQAVAGLGARQQNVRVKRNGVRHIAFVVDHQLGDALAVKAAQNDDFATLLDASQKIEAYFGFPAPNKLVQEAEIPGGMYSNMVAQLKQLKAEDILPRAMELIPTVRLSAGLPPLVTPTSQIVGAQAVNCALDEKAGRAMYTTKNNQFVNLVKGEYGKTPVKVDPEFRFKICGVREETNYDISKYQKQPNPELPEAGGVKLAENEKEVLLLELFPLVAKPYLTGVKKAAYEAKMAKETPKTEAKAEPAVAAKQPITGKTVIAPLPGKVIDIKVKVGDTVKAGQEVAILEAMKMENSITTDHAGVVKQILVNVGDNVQTDAVIIEIGDAAAPKAAPKAAVAGNKVSAPLPGRVIALKVKVGDAVKAGDEVAVLEAMKMENSITSDYAGTVQQILVGEGDTVQSDATLMIIG